MFNKPKPIWNNEYKKFTKQHADKHFEKNVILADKLSVSADRATSRFNGHICMLTNATEAKLWLYANILQMHSNYVIPDKAGEMYHETHEYLESNGYQVHVVDLRTPGKSCNVCAQIADPDHIQRLTEAMWKPYHSQDPFLQKAAEAVLSMMLYYLTTLPAEQQNLHTIMDLLHRINFNDVDMLAPWKMIKECSNPYARKCYEVVSMVGVRAAKEAITNTVFMLHHYHMLSGDIDFSALATGKHAIFIIHNDTNEQRNAMSVVYTRMLDILYTTAETMPAHQCERPVMVMLKQWIADASLKIITSSKYNIKFFMPWNSIDEVKHIYGVDWETMVYNCDIIIYMNTGYYNDFTHMVKMLKYGISPGRDNSLEVTTAMQKLTPTQCIVLFRGVQPFCAEKYNLSTHPRMEEIPFARR